MRLTGSFPAWLTLGCVWLFYLYEYTLRVAPSSITNDLMLALNMNATQLGGMLSLYYVAYVALQIPCGVIVDAWGPKRAITWSCVLCVVGTFLFLQVHHPWLVYMGRFLTGVGSACAFLSCGKVATQWFKPKYFPVIMGCSMMMGLFGATLGSYVMATLTIHMGWQASLWLFLLLGFLVVVVVSLGVMEPHHTETHSRLSVKELTQDLKSLIKEPTTWWLGLYGCCMYLPLSSFAELWSVPYIMAKYGIPRDQASIPAVFFFWGGGLGCVLSARLVTWIGQYRLAMLATSLFSCALFALEFYGPLLPVSLVVLCFGVNGMMYGSHLICFSLIKGSVSTQASGTAIGFMNFCVMSSGLIGATLMGWVLDLVWDGQIVDSIPAYSVGNYTAACSLVLGGALLLAAFSSQRIREPQLIKVVE